MTANTPISLIKERNQNQGSDFVVDESLTSNIGTALCKLNTPYHVPFIHFYV